jgi:hypothetical protein
MSKKCQECSEVLAGRSDKKFCSDTCRTSYNNKINSLDHTGIRVINSKLTQNRKILKELFYTGGGATVKNKPKKSEVKKETLLQKGFNFIYYTHALKKDNNHHFFCYEYGYYSINKDEFVLVKQPDTEY